MLVIDHVVIQNGVLEEAFVCDLDACKGACCEAGDAGAPLEMHEIDLIEENLDGILPYMSAAGKEMIKSNGFYTLDDEGDITTETLLTKECIFAVKDKTGKWACSIEKAWKDEQSNFRKPI